MSEKGCCLSNSSNTFLHINEGNGAMPLILRPKRPPYDVTAF